MVLSAGDWALKRFLKFILKRKLGKYLHELDMEALDVEIGTGKVELRQLLLKCDQLNADLNLQGWEVRACYLGSVKAQLPFSALGWLGGDCSVCADEVILIVSATQNLPPQRPNYTRQAGNDDPDYSAYSDTLWDELSEPGSDAPTTGMDEIIRRIANGLHTLLQRLSVSVTDILVRVEFPLPSTNLSLPQPSPEVGIVSITIERMSLTDGSDETPITGAPTFSQDVKQQQQQSSWWSGQTTQSKGSPAGGSLSLGAVNSVPATQVRKVVSVEGVSIQLYTGPALQTSSNSADSHAADSLPATGHKKPLHPPLLSGAYTENGIQGISCSLTVSVTSSQAQTPSVQLQSNHTTLAQVPAAVTATQVQCDVQLGPCLLRLMPEHIPIVNAIMTHASFLQNITPPAAQAYTSHHRAQPDHATSAPMQGVCDTSDPGLIASAHHPGQQLHSTAPEPWGTSSLLGSFLLDDYKDLVAHSLHPYVTQSLSMADSVMPEWANWHQQHDEQEDASLGYARLLPPSNGQRQAAAALSWQNSQPYEDLDLNQSFHDARSDFSSYPPSAANSLHSAMQAPERLTTTVGAQSSAMPRTPLHTYTNGQHHEMTHQQPVVLQQPPRRTQRSPPEYQIKLLIEEFQLLLGFGSSSGALQNGTAERQPHSDVCSHSLLVTLTEVSLQGQQAAGLLTGSIEVQQFQAMELIPINQQLLHPHIQGAGVSHGMPSSAHLRAYEFAAIPSKLHKTLHCFRPDPTWLQPPSWILQTTNNTQGDGSMKPVPLNHHAAGTTAAGIVCWPLLYCGGGLKSAGVRPCLTIRLSKQIPQSGTNGQLNGRGYANGGMQPSMGHWSVNGNTTMTADGICDAGDGYHSRTRQAGEDAVRLQLEMLPMTIWLCPDALQRISVGFNALSAAFAVSSSSNGGSDGGQTAKPSENTTKKLPELEVTVSIPHVCVLARASLMDKHQSASPQLPHHDHMYVLLDVLCPSHHDHVSHHRVSPHQGPPLIRLVCGRQPGELITRYSANAEVAIAKARLYVVHPSHAQGSTDSTAYGMPVTTVRTPHSIAVSGKARWVTNCLLEVGPRSYSSPVASSGHEPATGLGMCTGAQDLPPGCGIFASLLWDPQGPCAQNTGHEFVSHIQYYVAAHSASRWNDGESDGGDGETDSTSFGGRSSPGPGSCRSVELQERCRRSSHAFLRLCLSSVTLDVNDQDLDTLSRIAAAWQPPTELQASKDVLASHKEVMLSAKAEPERVQVMILAHAQLSIKLRPSYNMNNAAEQMNHSLAGSVKSESMSYTPCFSLTLEEISLTHVSGLKGGDGSTLVAVSAQGVCLKRLCSSPAGSLASQLSKPHRGSPASVMMQGSERHARASQFQSASSASVSGHAYEQSAWWQAPPEYDQCLLYCPLHATGRGNSAAQPCLDVVVFTAPTQLPATYTNHTQQSVVSVLIRGITISTDYGNLTMNWLQQLTDLLSPPKSDQQNTNNKPSSVAGTSTEANSSEPDVASEPAMQLVVSLQDIALRHEPLPYPTNAVAASYMSARLPEKTTTGKPAAEGIDSNSSSSAGQHSCNGDLHNKHKPTPSPVAMVLIAEHVRYESGGTRHANTDHSSAEQAGILTPGLQQHLVVINSVGLHLALANCRGSGWEPESACDVAGSKLQAYGYHCVLSESTLRVSIKVPCKPTSVQAAAKGSQPASATDVALQNAPAVDINIWNQQVLGVLTQDSAALLIQLSAQLGAYIAAATAPPLENINKIALSRAGSSSSQVPHRSPSTGSCNSSVPLSTTAAMPSMSSTSTALAGSTTAAYTPENNVMDDVSSEAGYEAITQKTEQLMRELLASDQHFRVGNGNASGADVQSSQTQAVPNGSIRSGYSAQTAVSGSSVRAGTSKRGQQQSGWYQDIPPITSTSEASASADAALTPGVIIIDDFFDVPSERPGSDDSADDLPYDWEVMRTSAAAVGMPPIGGAHFHNSPPEASGVWYSPGHTSPNRSSLDQPPGTSLNHTPTAHHQRGVERQLPMDMSSASNGHLNDHIIHTESPSTPPKKRGPSMRLHEDYVSTHKSSSTSAPTTGLSSQLAVSSRIRPTPSLRVTFNNFAGMSVLHTTRGSGGVQAGRVEAEVEGATLVIELYPQGGHDARLLHLSVRDLEIRDCRAQQKSSGQHHSSMTNNNHNVRSNSDSGPLPYLVPETGRATSSSGWSSGTGVDVRRSGSFSAAARVRSGLANGVGVAAQAASVTLGGAAKLATGRTEPKKWIKILSYRHKPDRPRDSRSAQLEVVMESVRPDPAAHPTLEEMRLQVAFLPVRLRLDQDVLQYLVAFAQAVMNPHTASALALLGQLQLAAQSGGDAAALPFFQMVQLSGMELVIDYRPRRIDVAALRAGSLMELLAMIPLGGLELSMTPVSMSGVAGWDQLGAAVARQWITHIAQTQAHKFLLGLAPVHALVRVGGAVSAVLNAPPVTRGVSRGIALASTAASVPLSGIKKLQEGRMATQVREGVVAFTRLLVAEALAKSSTMADGAQQLLSSSTKQLEQRQPSYHSKRTTHSPRADSQQTGQPEMLIAYAHQPTPNTTGNQPLQGSIQGHAADIVRHAAGHHTVPKSHGNTVSSAAGTSPGHHSGHPSVHVHRKPLTHHLGKGLHKIGKAANKISKSLSLGNSSSNSSSSRQPISMRALHPEKRATSLSNSAVVAREQLLQPTPASHAESYGIQPDIAQVAESSADDIVNQASEQQPSTAYQMEASLLGSNVTNSMHASFSNLDRSRSEAAQSISFMSSSQHTADIDNNDTAGEEVVTESTSALAPMLPLSSLLDAIQLVVGEYPPLAHVQVPDTTQSLADSQVGSISNTVHSNSSVPLLLTSTSQADLLGIGQNSGLDIASTADPLAVQLQPSSQPDTQLDASERGTASTKDSTDLLGIEDMCYSTEQPATFSTGQADVQLNLTDFSSQPPVRVVSSSGIKQRSVGVSHCLSPHADSSPMYSATSNTNSNDTWEDITSTKPGLGLLLDHAVASPVGHAGVSSGSLTSGDWVALSETVTARTSDSLIAGGVVLVSMEKEKTKRD